MKLKQLFVPLLAVFALSACSDDAPTNQAEKYTTLEMPVKVADLAPVTEVFSLSCGHCRSMEDAIPAIEEAASVKIGKAHVTFNESATFAALIYYAASTQEDGNPPKDLVEALFKYVQEQQTDSAEDNKRLLGDVFKQYGLTSPYDLDEAQQAKLFTALEQADALTVQSGINSVPTFLVKGKYVVNTSAHDSAEELGATLKMLLNKAD
ncbi:thiol-disulfide isomerase [Enterovibrio norvegicus]|uniref:thiol:disulfide interchange protein DsbA/DsbL n=1 Tax=Enterovibrio norvegicus TaxID=188144 RepID=UPI0002FFEA26|nr:thiol:disulfide interchange protein DsbA/DsbL [Enterovibrio norvegicus]MCC4796429.1 thiol:disulfide interchange protein DsbA/DsbL [Enterovibrio norvegicus]OEE60813.1 thiol-disulfide isomerase [Enterovibrio norvegicus]PMH65945.1 thiol-disulfide isomerase [Enterovibrio norvegicus]PMI32302.1 thiol-disulfide isomerase [Enterovibrio norvegicus]PMI33074.1 thiol-disulfide isomerase [Enterovibrio norvegicus]